MTTGSPTSEVDAIVARLMSKRFVRERWVEPVGTMDEPCDEDDIGAEAVLRNPDGPEAATLLQSLEARIEELEGALEGCRAEISKGRPIYSDSGTRLRKAIEAEQRKWFCSGSDCDAFDHGRDEGLQFALRAFDEERDRQLADQIHIEFLDNQARADLTPSNRDRT